MEYKIYKEILTKAFRDNSLDEYLNDEKIEKLRLFSDILIETNKSFNLTAITDEKEIILKHFVDCATVLKHLPAGSTLIDVGCGAGFPSIPIAILRGDVTVTALDSTEKKIAFIKKTTDKLSLNNLTAVAVRAEDFAKEHRECFDISISRAVARMNILDELCLPITKVGGCFIAMKSSRGKEEYEEARRGICNLGGTLQEHRKIPLKFEESTIERELFIIQKITKTSSRYPRSYSQILKKPL